MRPLGAVCERPGADRRWPDAISVESTDGSSAADDPRYAARRGNWVMWVCNAHPHSADVVMIGLPLGYDRYSQGPPLDYRHRPTTDPILSQMVGIYIKPGKQPVDVRSLNLGIPWGQLSQKSLKIGTHSGSKKRNRQSIG